MKGAMILTDDRDLMKYRYFFACIRELGGKAMLRLRDKYGDEKNIFENAGKETVENGMLTEKQFEAFDAAREKNDLDTAYEKFLRYGNGMKLVTLGMDLYPEKLKDIPGLPYNLFYYGELPDDNCASVAIVGARNCSSYGYDMAGYFGRELAKAGVQIISGMASGIDGISQQEALDFGAKSYGILGSGADICYPASNRRLYEKLKEEGGSISEYPPGTNPVAANFPIRNRIISGLSDIVLVVEAKMRSGTSITVNMALEQGRDVYAVPGRNTDELSRGCNKLIRDGAGIATDAECILEQLDIIYSGQRGDSCWEKGSTGGEKGDVGEENSFGRENKGCKRCEINDDKKIVDFDLNSRRKRVLNFLNPAQKQICEILFQNNNEMNPEEIYRALNGDMEIHVILTELMKMSLDGTILNRGGRYSIHIL